MFIVPAKRKTRDDDWSYEYEEDDLRQSEIRWRDNKATHRVTGMQTTTAKHDDFQQNFVSHYA